MGIEPNHSKNAPAVVYVASEARSGSTIVSRLLGDTADAVDVGELRNIWERGVLRNELCGCGAPFLECAFWSQVGERAFGGWDEDHAGRLLATGKLFARHRHGWQEILRAKAKRPVPPHQREWALAHQQLYRAIADVAGASVVIDSSKEPAYAGALLRAGLTDLRILHLVRDPRGVAHSFTRQKVRHEAASGGPQQAMRRLGAVRSVVGWTARNLQTQALKLLAPYVRQRYEGWTMATIDVREAEIAAGLGAPLRGGHTYDESGERVLLAPSHSVSGNPNRFEGGDSVALKSDEAWRDAPRTMRRATVTVLTFPLRLFYGYVGSWRR